MLAPAAGFAAWLSLGSVSFASTGGDRLGLLPVSPMTFLVIFVAAAGVGLLLWVGAARSPLSLLLLTLLPWLPLGVPAAFLIWSGPIVLAVWLAVALVLVRSIQRPSLGSLFARSWWSTERAPLRAGLVALLVFGAAAWRASPSLLEGDEPHYLVITQSLLLDGDLRIDNNHQRGDYRAYYGGELAPHYQRLGRGGTIYSIHAPGLPAIVLPAFALGGYRGVVVFLVFVAAAGSGLAWWVSWLATRRAGAAWFAWAAVTFSITTVMHSFSVYPDGFGGVLTLTGVWALLRANKDDSGRTFPWFWHGVALAVLPWLHSRFAVLAGTLGAVILLRLPKLSHPASKAAAFLCAPALSAVLWLLYFMALYGTPDPSVAYAPGQMGSLAWVPSGIAGLFFDQRFGLLPYAPVLAFALAGFVPMIMTSATRRLALELLFVMVPYLLAVGQFAMWWGGNSAPARFFVAALPMLCVPSAIVWARVEARPERLVPLAALCLTALVTAIVVSTDRGRMAFNAREAPALWLEWLSKAANLPQGTPWWSREGLPVFVRDVCVWVGAVLGSLLAGRLVFRRVSARHQPVIVGWALAVGFMAAASIVWTLRGVDGRYVVPAQLQLLRSIAASPTALLIDLERMRGLAVESLIHRLRIQVTRPLPAGRGRRESTLFQLPRIPAGQYRLLPAPTARGWLMVGIGRDQFSLHTTELPLPGGSLDLEFPIGVRAIVVRGDEDAGQTVGQIVIEPLTIHRDDDWQGEIARTAVRYRSAAVFFLDDRSFPEPEGFWIGGARSTAFVVRPDERAPFVSLLLRNGPVSNHATLQAGTHSTDLEFGPGEERRIRLPVDPARAASFVRVRVTGGFRPSTQEPANRDTRFLGLYVRIDA